MLHPASFVFDPSRYPADPGCYLMKGAAGQVLYVGKAVNLRKRLSSYFRPRSRDRRTASLDGEPLELSRLEFELLAHLARRSPEVVNRRELLAEVWRQPHGGADKTIDVHLSWLRRKLGESATQPRYLHTVRGVALTF